MPPICRSTPGGCSTATWHARTCSASPPGTDWSARAPHDPIDIIVESNAAKVDAIAKAQAEGTLTDRWSAVDLLALVLQISGLWSGMTPEFAALVADENHAHRRAVIVEAVRALLA